MASASSDELPARYRAVLGRIAAAARSAGRDPSSVTLIAVSKRQPLEAIEGLYRLGHRDFGENYVQELVTKARELSARGLDGIHWHFIGHLQTNKAKSLVPVAYSVHSIDSERVALALSHAWKGTGRRGQLPVFIEVNISGEGSKSGVAPADAPALARAVAALPELALQGLMCVPSAGEPGQRLSSRFRELAALERRCRPASRGRLSMGMSADFELAIAEGATDVRVGTALFGPRS